MVRGVGTKRTGLETKVQLKVSGLLEFGRRIVRISFGIRFFRGRLSSRGFS